MAKAQGSLELLLIIAAVLAITAMVVLYLGGVFGGQKGTVSITACKQAAVSCESSKMLSPNDPCHVCDSSCQDPTTGKEVFTGATNCCKAGRPDMIYDSSPGTC